MSDNKIDRVKIGKIGIFISSLLFCSSLAITLIDENLFVYHLHNVLSIIGISGFFYFYKFDYFREHRLLKTIGFLLLYTLTIFKTYLTK